MNTVYTRLALDVGVDKVLALARRMGLSSVREFDPAIHGASVALGAESTSPLDMASAYGVFAARGQRVAPVPVLRVIDRSGKVILDNSTPKPERVLPEQVADNVTDILRGVLETGTAEGRGIERPAAGKTGTTQDNRDAWFVGYTPTLSTAIWMGYENRSADTVKLLRGIKGVDAVTGGTHPARIWQSFMRFALADVPVTDFTEPAPIEPPPPPTQPDPRRGFDPAPRMYPKEVGTGGLSDAEAIAPPVAETPPTTSTTSTTAPAATIPPHHVFDAVIDHQHDRE